MDKISINDLFDYKRYITNEAQEILCKYSKKIDGEYDYPEYITGYIIMHNRRTGIITNATQLYKELLLMTDEEIDRFCYLVPSIEYNRNINGESTCIDLARIEIKRQ